MYKPFSGSYRSKKKKISYWYKKIPNLYFWPSLLAILLKGNSLAKKGQYNKSEWVKTSIDTIRLLEKLGVNFTIENIRVLENLKQPCVFVSNHMSALDAFIFPSIIRPFTDFTFVGKTSLVKSPLFKHIIMSRDPILVDRKNPREDFRCILAEGEKRLSKGTSILIFPQATRAKKFDIKQFNSIGVKLAKHARVPIIPIALCTDVWKAGRVIKDIGKIEPSRPVYVSFGDPINVHGRSHDVQASIIDFILEKLNLWGIGT
jgi:1-acyl-sn-glycerol-3-phosphate acyltransferase